MNGPKAFVTGGSGFTGGALCAHLLSRGYEVTALARLAHFIDEAPAHAGRPT
jgi:uncharacterized protein YbjT (DUF2867 family)